MKKLLLPVLLFVLVALTVGSIPASAAPAAAASASGTAEAWKGKSDGAEVHLGAIAGLGIIDFNPGFVLLGTASKKIVQSGFVPDITNSVSIETQMGPIFVDGTALFSYSLHLRWDFEKDERWIFYALGGAGGYITGSGYAGGNSFMLFPRLGIGTLLRVNDLLEIRGEVSHELIAAGIAVPLYF
jgi:hypothetical protein